MSLFASVEARRNLGIEPDMVDSRGRVTLRNFTAARRLARALEQAVEAPEHAARVASAGELVALAVLDEIYRALLGRYVRRRDATLFTRALGHLASTIGARETAAEIEKFRVAFGLRSFPRDDRDETDRERLASNGQPGDERTLFEFALFWLQWRNPAAAGLLSKLQGDYVISPPVERMFDELERFLASCIGLGGGSLAADLLAPFAAHPDSLSAQLELLRRTWGEALGAELWQIQSALDLIAEETTPRWGDGGDRAPEEPGLPTDGERRYSIDRDWMPRLVLVAKNTLVWLHQLSVAYGREISRLDQIPREELELLSGRGITGLWLIGLWERSWASGEIKRRRGNPEAASSAYSLRSYRIAQEFGGDEALETLRRRADRYGVRLAADMVPNHMGIDSDWVLDHPERFVQVSEPPFPAYSFTGADLSPRADVGIFLEDHYYEGTDAAVVFKRVDRRTGESTYIFHGNDGTSTPWNDTAQLDYLDPSVREAVIQTILDVARRFPVIRFDAAMTLAKRHYHRLWHPQPGDAGAIPSRSEHSLSREALDRLMPREFWRELVDRVAREAPDTLLLAEAFWLMEGYFVRTLGLHRVYNSAFMHMMRDQETGKYRRLIKETLAFDPEILCRYVNFMSNPDEESAAEQFELGDRYFGACTVLATLPGLPMFAHGQWDGLREKYGMEYRRSYREEEPVREIIERHDREIAPLLARRATFAGVESFRLYDFVDTTGNVCEDVLAYSNVSGDESALVVFNNSPNAVRGSIGLSAPFRRSAEAPLEEEPVHEALSMPGEGTAVFVVRDPVRGAGVLVPASSVAESGLELELGPFGALVCSRFERIADPDGSWTNLARALKGRCSTDLDGEMMRHRAPRLVAAVDRLADAMSAPFALSDGSAAADGESDGGALREQRSIEVDQELAAYLAGPPFRKASSGLQQEPQLRSARHLAQLVQELLHDAPESVRTGLRGALDDYPTIRFALAVEPVARAVAERTDGERPFRGLAELLCSGLDDRDRADVGAILELSNRERWLSADAPPAARELGALAEVWGNDADARQLLGVHEAGGNEWLVSERLELLLAARLAFAGLSCFLHADEQERGEPEMACVAWRLALGAQRNIASEAGYRLDVWMQGGPRSGEEIDGASGVDAEEQGHS